MWVLDKSAGRFALSTSEPGRTGMLPSESQPWTPGKNKCTASCERDKDAMSSHLDTLEYNTRINAE